MEGHRPGRGARRDPFDGGGHGGHGVLSGLLVLEVLLGFTNGLTEGRNWHDTQSKVADVTANIKAAPDQLVQTFSPYIYSTEQVRRLAAFASADRLSLFATSLGLDRSTIGPFRWNRDQGGPPPNGATLSGKALLDATTASTANGTTVQFRVTGHGLHDALVATGQLSPYGWLASWDTTTVAGGSYQLRSAVSYAGGKTVESPSITVVVDHRAHASPTG